MVWAVQAGFAMLTAGSVREKNCMNVLLKNIIDACIAGIFFYLFGQVSTPEVCRPLHTSDVNRLP